MINNRQAGRRNNRGRNNGRQNGGNRGGGDNGNRVDSRARGNAPQLLEKYRNLARDAQLAGDRVNTEYYLQFADHYFRIIADNRARQEEHQARFRRNDEPLDDMGDPAGESTEETGAAFAAEGGDGQLNRDERYSRDDRYNRDSYNRDSRDNRDDRRDDRQSRQDPRQSRGRQPRPMAVQETADGDGAEPVTEESSIRRQARRAEKIVVTRRDQPSDDAANDVSVPVAAAADVDFSGQEDAAPAKRAPRGRKPRRVEVDEAGEGGLDLAALPPAISRAESEPADMVEAAEEKPAPRRRGRRPKAEIEAEAAAE
ncbi:MAG: DUF4167 domain-containing protein [Sphingobium sp.]|nr:DUF4167 domain-containing protein [Sphingobium sp.]